MPGPRRAPSVAVAFAQVRAASDLADLAREKNEDIDGRLEAGTRLYMLLSTAAGAHKSPRPILRSALAELTHQMGDLEAEVDAAQAELKSV